MKRKLRVGTVEVVQKLLDIFNTFWHRNWMGFNASYFIYKCQVVLFQLEVSVFFQRNHHQMFVHKKFNKAKEGKACQKTQRFNALIKNIWFDLQDMLHYKVVMRIHTENMNMTFTFMTTVKKHHNVNYSGKTFVMRHLKIVVWSLVATQLI